jgi:hypothetical protein
MRRLVISLVLLISLASASIASAQDAAGGDQDARALFTRGQAAYTQGDYEDAIAQWTRAWALDPRPLLQYNMSQAYERLGRLEEAVAALQLYLDHAAAGDEHLADARARQSQLRERIAQTSVRITGGPEGATILVDGEDRGRTPRPDPLTVAAGSHRIVVRAAGYDDFTSSVVVPPGQVAEVVVEMQQTAVATTQTGAEFPLGPVILMGAGGAAVIVGAILGGVALGNAQSAPSRTSPEADSARGMALGADILMFGGAAIAAGGLIWLLVAPPGGGSAESEATAATVLPWSSPDGAGITVTGRF